MYVDTFNLDGIDWNLDDLSKKRAEFRGSPVYVINQPNAILNSIFGNTHQQRQNFVNLKVEIKPCMHMIKEVEVGYKHTNADGKSDEITASVKFKDDNGRDKETSNNENNTKTRDIDSRDRDRERDRD